MISLAARAKTELASGVPFLSDKDLKSALGKARVPKQTADEIVKENTNARIDALRSSLSVIAIIALIALYSTISIPLKQPGSPEGDASAAREELAEAPAG